MRFMKAISIDDEIANLSPYIKPWIFDEGVQFLISNREKHFDADIID